MADSELRKALNSRATAGLGEDNSEQPCFHQWDRPPPPGSVSWEQFCETQTPTGSPHIHETKAVQACFTCWTGRVGSTEYGLSHEDVKGEFILYIRQRNRKKEQFQDPLVAKSKTNAPQGMGTRGCSQVTTSKLIPQGDVSLEEFRMSEQPRQHNRTRGTGVASSQAKA